jgi:hypothetical protein
MSHDYWRKTKDYSGEVMGAEKLASRIRRIKDKDHEKYVKLFVDGTRLECIPPEIYKLDHLEVLWATGNKLTTVPEEITWLIRLQNLRLDRNRIEKLPPWIGRLPSLTHLGLNKNRLKSLPEELAQLTKLESLYLAENPDLPEEQNRDFKTFEETQAFLQTLKRPLIAATAAGTGKAEGVPLIVDAAASLLPPVMDATPAADAAPLSDGLD